MSSVLIGYTGFVGGGLLRSGTWTHCYNNSNIGQICGRKYRRIVCAGIQAKKWWANQNPQYVVRRVGERLNKQRKSLNGSRILVMGLAYKSNVDGMRESPTFKLFDLLKAEGAEVSYYDPHVPVITPTPEHAEYTGWKPVEWNRDTVSGFDLVLISTNHAWSGRIVDTRNAMTDIPTRTGHVTKA